MALILLDSRNRHAMTTDEVNQLGDEQGGYSSDMGCDPITFLPSISLVLDRLVCRLFTMLLRSKRIA